MGGLVTIVFLSVGACVMLTRNLWTEVGLCNGSCGTKVDIIYPANSSPPSLPVAVLVKSYEYYGPTLLGSVPIAPITSTSDSKGSAYKKT